jgi:hypothetical protein
MWQRQPGLEGTHPVQGPAVLVRMRFEVPWWVGFGICDPRPRRLCRKYLEAEALNMRTQVRGGRGNAYTPRTAALCVS